MQLTHLQQALVTAVSAAALAILSAPIASGQDAHVGPPMGMVLRGPGSHIGVSIRDIEVSETERQRVQGGAVVEDVLRGSPAEKAGLKKGDVFVEFDGEHVRSARQLARLVEETPPGRTVKTTVLREGRRTDVSVTPSAERRADVSVNGDQLRLFAESLPPNFNFDLDLDGFPSRGRLGVTVEELPSQLADYFGAKSGVLVAAVQPDSPAARAGLKAGDVITKVGGTAVHSRRDLVLALREAGDDDEAAIEIVRDKKESTLKARLEPARRSIRSRSLRPA